MVPEITSSTLHVPSPAPPAAASLPPALSLTSSSSSNKLTMISDRSKLYERVSVLQRLSGRLAVIAAAASLICVIAWMGGYDKSQKFMGGFNTNELLFNYHPVFMTLGMLFCGLSSMLTYRIVNMPKLSFTKPLHGLLHTFAIVFLSLGLYAVFEGNNNKNKNEYDSYYANLYSIHSFVGLGAILVYGCNYVLGLLAYFLGWVSDDSKRAYMPYHVFFGVFSLVLIFIAVETGIMDLSREIFCDIAVDSPDYNPAANYHNLPAGCRTANAAGILVMLTALLALFAITDLRREISGASGTEYLLHEDIKA